MNCSQLKKIISDKVVNTFDEDMFDMNEHGNESIVSFKKLQDENLRRQVQLEDQSSNNDPIMGQSQDEEMDWNLNLNPN